MNKLKSIKTIDFSKQQKDLVKFRIPTGIKAIDVIVGGGIPAGKLTEIYGDFSSGKTRLACHIIAQTQKLGGDAIFIDNERSLSPGLLDLTGVDASKLIYPDPDTEIVSLEDVFRIMRKGMEELRDTNKDGLLTVVWDSVATAPASKELKEDALDEVSGPTRAMQRAKIISDGLKQIMPLVHSHKICLVFINQIRDRIGVMYGEKIDTVGGMSIKFQSSLRLHCRLVGKIKGDKSGEMIGNKGRLVVGKSKVCKPFRLVNFDMLVDKPIDEFSGLLDYYVRHGQIESNRGWYNLPDDDNKWRESDFPKIYKENKKYFEGAK